MERKIGEIFEYNGEWYQCVESDGTCNGCAGEFKSCSFCFGFEECVGKIFKKLEKVGETYEKRVSDGTFSTFQKYKVYNSVILPQKPYMYCNFIDNTIEIEIKQTSLNSTKGIYEKFKGKTVQCLVNNKDGDLVNGYGIVCGYKDKYLIIGFTNEYEGCIKSFTDNVFLENRDFLSYRFWNISHVDDKPFIKPFNLEAAKQGKPVCTRDGRKGRIIAFDRRLFYKNVSYPILALVERSDGEDDVCGYNEKGKVLIEDGAEYKDDLMMLPEKKEGWVNVYTNIDVENSRYCSTIYASKEEALNNISKVLGHYISTGKTEWEE